MKKLGFGCMRLPMTGGAEGQVDLEQFTRMVDLYMDAGFCYFDTARVYINRESERALREALVKRYPRNSFLLTDKLSGSQFSTEADIRPLFEEQLQDTGVDYFDYYLMHAMARESYEKFEKCHAFRVVSELKAEGKIKHMGISFHDKPAVLERILQKHPEIEVVQIQLNYLDYDDPSIESGAVYEVCRKYEKPIFVMEPVKGGGLADLPPDAAGVFRELGQGSPASYALRYAAGFEGVEMVLSGMSNVAQMADNIAVMEDPKPLDARELAAIAQVREILRQQDTVPCTACRYCVAGCPKGISIPDLFACLNTKRVYQDWGSDFYYTVHTKDRGKASDCIGCRRCEKSCPQHLEVTALLRQVAEAFEQ